ncbi:pseudouridine synthase [uncultured Pseudoteredinibacter sp.]|uniref:pseudouridine synthase n=1 Tax=uncultured Pseudoteredinibacter sp. TaxID=1641701 RepID=UPI00261D540A|nr:pseudouridine synthase [uncultured Pseudoteredinibacter sp.]
MRLDRFLIHNANISRQDCLALIKAGRVQVSGKLAESVAQLLEREDTVSLDGQPLCAKPFSYLVVNKPAGAVSARADKTHPTVLDFIKADNFVGELPAFEAINIAKLQIVGRLDIDTTGLLLLTDDGEWNYRLTAPEHHCVKTYRVQLNSELADGLVEKFADGFLLQGEQSKTLAAKLEPVAPKEVLLSISEGRYHQIKRMFKASKNRVVGLHRESIAGLDLIEGLSPGQFRFLSAEEVARLE